MSRNAFLSSYSEKKKSFDIDIVVKCKSKCSLAWSILLYLGNDTRHHSGQNLLWTYSAAPQH